MKRLLAVLAMAGVLTGCTSAPLHNPTPSAIPEAKTADIRSAIVTAATSRHWNIVKANSDHFLLSYPSGAKAQSFEVIVRVDYDKEGYQVSYVSSRGLDEQSADKTKDEKIHIHRNVNRWMANLNKDIQAYYQRNAYRKAE